jgi:hypothetical protein
MLMADAGLAKRSRRRLLNAFSRMKLNRKSSRTHNHAWLEKTGHEAKAATISRTHNHASLEKTGHQAKAATNFNHKLDRAKLKRLGFAVRA